MRSAVLRKCGMRNAKCGMRMSGHPKSSSEVKNDWLVVAMQATEGSRNADRGRPRRRTN